MHIISLQQRVKEGLAMSCVGASTEAGKSGRKRSQASAEAGRQYLLTQRLVDPRVAARLTVSKHQASPITPD